MCISLLFTATVPAFAMITKAYVQLVHITDDNIVQIVKNYDTLNDAVLNAANGDVIEVYSDISVDEPIVIPSNIELTIASGTLRENTANFGSSVFEYTNPNATTRTVKKNFTGSLFTLSENSSVNFKNIILSGNGKSGIKGGLIYAENGATANLIKGTFKSGVKLINSTLGANSFGGAVYAERGSAINVENATFSGNSATVGKDIYAEQEKDVSLSKGIVADFSFAEAVGVEINGLNLILDGEIGLCFHTKVPEVFLEGSFVLNCKNYSPVTYNISGCEKDLQGRYLVRYNLNAVELSEPITLTVYDKKGNPLATKQKSVEDYGKALILQADTSEKVSEVVTKLLNYGHFAQIEYSDYEGKVANKDYTETAKYSEITTTNDVLDSFKYYWKNYDAKLQNVSAQLELGYKTKINIYFSDTEKPYVTVNGANVDVSEYAPGNYKIVIDGISALDITKEFTVSFGGNTSLTLSAASYFNLALQYGNENNINAMKSLYEFYLATVNYKQSLS